MPVQKFPLEIIQKIRQHMVANLTIPTAENVPTAWSQLDDGDDVPEPDSLSDLGNLFNFGAPPEMETHAPNTDGKWFISSVNPGAALSKLPGLKLKPNTRLVGYLHRTQTDGRGIIWALPESLSTTSHLEKVLSATQQPPRPDGAYADVMEAIEGDHSPASYLIASILRREFQEFGAKGKACRWSHHRLIQTLPPQLTWQWQVAASKDLSPKVLITPEAKKVAIEFFTCRTVAPVAIYQHIDQYPLEQYKATPMDRVVAVPQGK